MFDWRQPKHKKYLSSANYTGRVILKIGVMVYCNFLLIINGYVRLSHEWLLSFFPCVIDPLHNGVSYL